MGVGKSTLGGYQLLNIPAGIVLNLLKITSVNPVHNAPVKLPLARSNFFLKLKNFSKKFNKKMVIFLHIVQASSHDIVMFFCFKNTLPMSHFD